MIYSKSLSPDDLVFNLAFNYHTWLSSSQIIVSPSISLLLSLLCAQHKLPQRRDRKKGVKGTCGSEWEKVPEFPRK
jgi:hypothetical protein